MSSTKNFSKKFTVIQGKSKKDLNSKSGLELEGLKITENDDENKLK